MSSESHHKSPVKQHEQGTTKSYVIGFILSLIFTIIPYYLVVNQVITGNALLVAILGIAVLQMAIQMYFFLHLGRGPKPLYNVVFFFATAGIIVLTVGASLFIMGNLYENMQPDEVTQKLAQKEGIAQVGGKETGACQGVKENHIVTISNDVVSPILTKAQLCDTLTIINKDAKKRVIAFGLPNRVTYGGEYEVKVEDDPETITLNEIGSFSFYDMNEVSVNALFSVSEH